MKKCALITGATSGIGQATSHLFASKGIHLIVSGRQKNQLDKLEKHLSSQVNVQSIQANLIESAERQKLITALKNYAPDFVINNAGFGLYGDALTYSTQEQLDILEVNGKAVLELTLEAARALLLNNKQGVILNVSSASAFQIFPSLAVYAASKAFVNHFSQALDFEFKPYGIRVLTLCPGMVATDFQNRAGSINNQEKGMMSPDYIAEKIWSQIQNHKRLSIVDWKYHLLTCFSKFLPVNWVASLEKTIIANRIPPRNLIKK